MNLIGKLAQIENEINEMTDKTLKQDLGEFFLAEEINCPSAGSFSVENILAKGDNLAFMKHLLAKEDMKGKLKLIYIDPPFFSKASYDGVIRFGNVDGKKLEPIKYTAYEDIWQRDMGEYLKMLCLRLRLMKELLSSEGTIWVHLDWHVVHYVKVFMDEIFGEENFVNEIIWQYKSGGSGKKHFARKHDTILVYSKTGDYYFAPPKEKSYNRGFKPYRFKGVKEYKDDLGWYTMVTMKDVWNVDMVGRTSAERTGYATQKPEALLERIIEGATKEGDLCADFFCGSGTLASVAEKMNRRWICCDGSQTAISATVKRLHGQGASIRILEQEMRGHVPEAMGKTKDKAKVKASAKVKLQADREEMPGLDKVLLKVTIQGYELGSIPGNIDEKGQETLKLVQKKDSLQLLEYWSMDTDYDGKTFRPTVMFQRDKKGLCTTWAQPVSTGLARRVMVKAVDVLGNCVFQEV